MNDCEPLVELKSIAAGYAGKVVLHNVDLTICQHDFLGIIGPNGGGKTTLLKVILGLLTPYQGTITFSNHSDSPHVHIGYLPQFKEFDNQFPIKVIDVVLSGLMSSTGLFGRFSRHDKDKAEHILEKFGAYALKDRAIGELSGGQMQRIFLCRALISSPGLLILDEPATFVDQNFSQNLNDILKELNKDIAIVLVSHDIGAVISSVKNIACVNSTLHYHSSDEFSQELLEKYQCSFHLVGHGEIPHTVLKRHGNNHA